MTNSFSKNPTLFFDCPVCFAEFTEGPLICGDCRIVCCQDCSGKLDTCPVCRCAWKRHLTVLDHLDFLGQKFGVVFRGKVLAALEEPVQRERSLKIQPLLEQLVEFKTYGLGPDWSVGDQNKLRSAIVFLDYRRFFPVEFE